MTVFGNGEKTVRLAWSNPDAVVRPAFSLPRGSMPEANREEDASCEPARQRYLRAASELAQAKENLIDREFSGLVELAFAVGDELARHALTQNREATFAAIRTALEELTDDADVEIRVSPADHAAQVSPDLALVPDKQLADGDFIIVNPNERMTDTMENRRAAIRRRMGLDKP